MGMKLRYYLMGFVLFNVFDAGATLLLLKMSGNISEGNLLLNQALHHGVAPFLLLKFTIIGIVALMILYISRRKPVIAMAVTKFGASVYMLVIGYEIALMSLLFTRVL